MKQLAQSKVDVYFEVHVVHASMPLNVVLLKAVLSLTTFQRNETKETNVHHFTSLSLGFSSSEQRKQIRMMESFQTWCVFETLTKSEKSLLFLNKHLKVFFTLTWCLYAHF